MSSTEKWNPKSIGWWHEALADWMLLNPDQNLKDAALLFKVSVNYIYMLKNSDSFKEYWAFRRAKQLEGVGEKSVDQLGGLGDKLSAVADMALDQILEQLAANAKTGIDLIDHDELRSTADMALKKLGYGLPAAPGSAVQNTQVNVVIDSKLLAEAREKMKQMYGVSTTELLEIEKDK